MELFILTEKEAEDLQSLRAFAEENPITDELIKNVNRKSFAIENSKAHGRMVGGFGVIYSVLQSDKRICRHVTIAEAALNQALPDVDLVKEILKVLGFNQLRSLSNVETRQIIGIRIVDIFQEDVSNG